MDHSSAVPRTTGGTHRRRARGVVAAGLAAVVGAATLWAGLGTASAAVNTPVRAIGSGRCLDVPNASTANGTQLIIWDCHGRSNQAFTTTTSGQLQVSGKCVDANGTAAGATVIIWDCHGGANQRWTFTSNGSVTNGASGLCLDVCGAATANSSRLIVWTCNGQSNQRFAQSGGPTPTPTPTATASPTPTPTAPGGGTTCNVAPVDAQATPAARKLLCYVYSQYGNHILSGQQESTWVDGPDYEMNLVRAASGKYPAIRGQDMGDSPTFGARGLSWWNAGGIPMVGYHMGSPAQGSDGYAGSQMNANISAALTSGTADNTRLNQRLTGWANQLKIIQNGGGAVLFRPWHEASGTWFWWSKEGAGQYNRLWVYTYNFMRAQGVHNLVYLHPYNGSPSAAWYPGKQYVDIGGADTYASNHGPLTSMYTSARSIYGSTLPIALHENGRIPDPAQLQSAGARWVLFNTWHTSFISDTSINSRALVNTVYNSAYVVTRDEVPNLR